MLKRKGVLEWAEKHVYLSGTKFRREEWPLLCHILQTIEDNPGSIFVVLGAVQTVKTLLAQIWVAYCMQVEPRHALWYTKTADQAGSLTDKKLTPLIDGTCLRERAFYGNPDKTTRFRISLPSGHAFSILSAGAQINRQQESAQDIILDELWTYDSAWHEELANRHAADEFTGRWREIIISTAPDEGHILQKLYSKSTKYNLQWKCPHCGKDFVPDFGERGRPGGIKFSCVRIENGTIDEAATAASAHYECPHCITVIPWSGSWVKAQAARQQWAQTNEKPAARVFGWWIPDWLVRPWGDLVVKFQHGSDALKLGDIETLKNVLITRFAKPWKQLEQARGEKKPRNIGAYKMGEKWSKTLIDEYGLPASFVTVDVQKDCYYIVARAWAKGGSSRLLECARAVSDGEITELALRHGIPAYRVFLDSRHDTTQVARLCSMHGWRMMMGDKAKDFLHVDGTRRIYAPPRWVDPFLGTELQGEDQSAVMRFIFSKAAALDRLHLLRRLGVDMWSGASDAPEWYWVQNEAHYTAIVKKPDGSEFTEWRGLKDDHAGDCEAMQIVVASIAGLLGVSENNQAQAPA